MARIFRQIACRTSHPHIIFKASYRQGEPFVLSSFRGRIDEGLLRTSARLNRTKVCDTDRSTKPISRCAPPRKLPTFGIPPFLARQTDLLSLLERRDASLIVEPIRLFPRRMKNAVDTVASTATREVLDGTAGSSCGYQISWWIFRGISAMTKFGYPVVFD